MYEQSCALCDTPMFSPEPMKEGEIHATCDMAFKKGQKGALELAAELVEKCSSNSVKVGETIQGAVLSVIADRIRRLI